MKTYTLFGIFLYLYYPVHDYLMVILCYLGESDSEHEDQHSSSKNASSISDMDYLKSKIVAKGDTSLNDDEQVHEKQNDDDDSDDDSDDNSDDGACQNEPTQQPRPPTKSQTAWTLKMRGLPFKVKDKHIKEFFFPVKCSDIRLVKNKKGQPSGRAFVDFESEKDLEKALKRDKDYLEGRYIELFRDDNRSLEPNHDNQEEEKPWMKKLRENKNNDEEDESIGEVSSYMEKLNIKLDICIINGILHVYFNLHTCIYDVYALYIQSLIMFFLLFSVRTAFSSQLVV